MKTEINIERITATLKLAAECIKSNRRHLESIGRHPTVGTSNALDEIDNTLKDIADAQNKVAK